MMTDLLGHTVIGLATTACSISEHCGLSLSFKQGPVSQPHLRLKAGAQIPKRANKSGSLLIILGRVRKALCFVYDLCNCL